MKIVHEDDGFAMYKNVAVGLLANLLAGLLLAVYMHAWDWDRPATEKYARSIGQLLNIVVKEMNKP